VKNGNKRVPPILSMKEVATTTQNIFGKSW